jgi:hypothetical protein
MNALLNTRAIRSWEQDQEHDQEAEFARAPGLVRPALFAETR